jgi:membrane protein involved in colicin uptake
VHQRIAAGALAVTAAASTIVIAPASATATEEVPALQANMTVVTVLHSHPITAAGRITLAKEKAAKARARHAAAVAAAKRKAAIARARAKAKAKAAAAARTKAAAAARARASRAAARRALLTPSYTWAHQPFSIRVANCESGDGPRDHASTYNGNAHLHDPNGHYGKWQFDFSTWREVGGSGNPADASEKEQDSRAFALWRANGWSRWECARLVG